MSSTQIPFNLATVLEQCGGKAEIVGMVLDEFLNQVPTDMGEMEAGITAGNFLTASKMAHRLKGTAGVLGATKLYALCAAMEQACKADSPQQEAARLYAELKTESAACVEAVPAAKTALG